ncbi:hypothetical protein [Miniphocaeibacter massiliensis]|uniref:hypothetical protein n=1 Tax=Miniphocaeibacter massiliensis TaxID=2041841 RepID=UPI000C1B9211|nr:hypothetical protein [Miniphocaeibacter massiliensis]
MNRKFLTLGLILIMSLTACSSGKDSSEPSETSKSTEQVLNKESEISENQLKVAKEYLSEYSSSSNGLIKTKLDEKNKVVEVVIQRVAAIENPDDVRNGIKSISEFFKGAVGEGFTIRMYYLDDSNSNLVVAKDGEIVEDNLEEYLKNNPSKKSDANTFLKQYVEGANSTSIDFVKTEYDENSNTFFIVVEEGKNVDSEMLRQAVTVSTNDIFNYVGEGYFVKLVYKNKKDNPLILAKDGKIVQDILK